MTKQLITIALALLFSASGVIAQESEKKLYLPDSPVPAKYKPDTRIDNMAYWRRLASLGLVPVAPDTKVPAAKYTGSQLNGRGVASEDSPDVPVTTENSTQSENSIFVSPLNNQHLLQSNNSTGIPASNIYGANDFLSTDGGNTWGGELQGAGGNNSGDPATAVGLNGNYYVGYIHSSGGQGVSYSTNQGQSWTPVLVAPSPGGWGSLLDKNHMWIDNSVTSPYEGNLYDAWTNFGGSNDTEIEISRSTNDAVSWSAPVNISSAINAGSHNQGVNINTGPNGEVYVIWAIYDSWPSDESSIGMAKSFDGGVTWQTATRIISNIRGIRNSGTGKNMRVNAFPTMTVDISNGANRGAIYVTWANTGTPGINTGNDIDIYMIKSTDQGSTWSAPVKVNQDASGQGKQHYLPWITSDPANGNLSVIYYDDRNVSSTQCEAYVSTSTDGGATWEDMKVSDVSFTPQSIAGLADGYFGDYLAITARDRWVFPAWTDNRTGTAMTYVSPFQTGPPPNQPWVIYNASTIDDASGNNNGLLDFGENAFLDITMENIGDQPATAVEVILSTESPYVTITDNTEQFGDFTIGEIKSIASAFAIEVSSEIPDGEALTFTLTATDAVDSTFISNFMIEAHAPALQTGSISINDGAGNANGRLDPGESAIISIETFNPGDYTAESTTAQLTSPSQYITITNQNVELGDILPGSLNTVTAQFEIQVAPETPVGHAAAFNYTAISQMLTATKIFNLPVGLILEDFESGGFETFDWQFAGTAPWTIATDQIFEGANSAKSGDINDSQSSEMKIDYNVMNEDSISFFVRVSSESSYDFLKFYINGTMAGQWSGEVNWTRVAFPVQPGEITFSWIYSKDVSVSNGSDAAWVDYIVFPAPLQTTVYAGPDAITCENTPVMLNGVATNYESSMWTSMGDGTFEDATQLSTFYTPGPGDITAGSASLQLTVNGLDGDVKTDILELSVSAASVVVAGADTAICANTESILLNASGSNYSDILWTTNGSGAFDDATSLTPVYTPSEADITAGSVMLKILAISATPCSNAMDSLALQFIQVPTATIGGETGICAGSSVSFNVELTGTAPWTFEVNNGVGTIMTSEAPYTVEVTPAESTSYQVLSVTDANMCSSSGTGEYNVTIYSQPQISLVSDTTACANHTVLLTAHTTDEVSFLWMPGEYTTQSISVDTTGYGIGTTVWTVTATTANNCQTSASVSVNFNDCTGINEISSQPVSLYPNPTSGEFSIIASGAVSGNFRLDIYDAGNKLVYTQNTVVLNPGKKALVKAGKLAQGIYLLKLSGTSETYSTKLIVK